MSDRISPSNPSEASVAIVIPSLNSPIINKVVAAVIAQAQFERVEGLFVIGQDKAGLLEPDERIRFIETERPILAAAARNRGITASKAEIIIFLDSDFIAQPGWLAEHIAAHKAGHAVVSGGVLPEGHNYWHLSYNLTLFHELLSINTAEPKDFLATLNLSVKRSVIEQVGMMNETINRVEDVDWTTRMRKVGIQPFFWPDAAVYHDHNRDTMQAVWRDCALSGFHMRQLRLAHPGWLQAPGILRFRLLVLLLSPFIAGWATLRIMLRRTTIVRHFLSTIPAIYLTKIAWCWGASQKKPLP
jgi:GT2 family glycosyltransferase